jgi:hypothetical protein
MNSKKLILPLLLTFFYNLYSQNNFRDYFVYKNGDTIRCNITKAKNQRIYFSLPEKHNFILTRKITKDIKYRKSTMKSNSGSNYTPNNLNFYECQNIFISPESKSKIALSDIETPEEGYAHIYFYKPYAGMEPIGSFIIKEGEKKLVNLKTNSSFLIKVRSGTQHTYSTKMNLFNKSEVTILAENKEIYYIKASTECYESGVNNQTTLCGRKISLDKSNHSELQVLTMYKNPKIY